jgi:hypothetical protein
LDVISDYRDDAIPILYVRPEGILHQLEEFAFGFSNYFSRPPRGVL